MWTCSCLGYLNSRFLLCKHLVQSVHSLKPNFFNEVTRYRSLPFWRHQDLIPLMQGLEPAKKHEVNEEYELADKDISIEKDVELNDENNEEFAETWDEINSHITKKLCKWIDLLKSQEQYRDIRFFSSARRSNE
ncbi:19528_t:CDS:2 [Gigaspora rosea]|nr:19528_t:CDS:2 [Gigaspora rosea]